MAIEIGKKDQPVPPTDTGVRRRGLLNFGTLMAAFTGASAVAALGASSAQAAPGDKYIPIAEKGSPSGVAGLDGGAKILPSQLPDLSATILDEVVAPIAAAVAPKLDSATAATTYSTLATTQTITGSKSFHGSVEGGGTGLLVGGAAAGATGDPVVFMRYPSINRQVQVRDEMYVRTRFGVGASPSQRIPINLTVNMNGSLLTKANNADKVALCNTVTFSGDFSNEATWGMSSASFVFGANDFITTGSTAGDLTGIFSIYGRLSEVHIYSPGRSLTQVIALQAEAHVEASARATNVTSLMGLQVKAPRNEGGGVVTTAYGIKVESPTTGATNYAINVSGSAESYFGGKIRSTALEVQTGAAKFTGATGANAQGAAAGAYIGINSGNYGISLADGVNTWVIDNNAGTLRFMKAGVSQLAALDINGKYTAAKLTTTSNTADALSITTPTQTTAPAAGGGAALPATPAGYTQITIGGTARWIPYY